MLWTHAESTAGAWQTSVQRRKSLETGRKSLSLLLAHQVFPASSPNPASAHPPSTTACSAQNSGARQSHVLGAHSSLGKGEGQSFLTSTFLKGKFWRFFHSSKGQGMRGRLKQAHSHCWFPFSPVTADRSFTNVPTDLIAADTNNAVHILSANANNALGIITVNTNNYC